MSNPIDARTRVQGDGFVGGGWTLYRIVGAAESEPTDPDLSSVNSRRAADVVWAAMVMDGDGSDPAQPSIKVSGRTFDVTFGRFVSSDCKPKLPIAYEIAQSEEEVTSSPTVGDLVYLQPGFGDNVFAYVSDVGNVNTAGGERIWLFYKHANRRS